ncbi:MAG TPA: prenyltransferase/squalene oxidase repeat-containing protein [Gemmataceae bacterium]|jgi:N-acyl-D-amino-acid deacylase|nr:prenyltransferase/squalene oxidase repeat-containing protein [Gemmataceae bacterium]
MKILTLAGIGWGLLSPAWAEVPNDAIRAAIEKSLPRIEQGAANYIKNRQCFSCHHQAMAMLSLSSAQERGFTVESVKIKQQTEFTLDTFRPKKEQILKGAGVPGGNTMAAYALFALEAVGHAPDETTGLLVEYLLIRQKPDGSWPALAQRPPTEGSTFTNNALALRGLRQFGLAKDTAGGADRAARIEKAFQKGRAWLLQNQPANTEDKMFRLQGLVAARAEQQAIDDARQELLKEQREDGSWAQLPSLAGDAYATGGVLVALRSAGLKVTDSAYQKGIHFLLAKQNPDGSWIVETRSRPVQIFFDNGDPGGKSQFISFAATNWAILALLEAIPRK